MNASGSASRYSDQMHEQYNQSEYESTLDVYSVYIDECTNQWSVDMNVGSHDVICFRIDTGAECCLMSKNTYDNLLHKPKMFPSHVTVRGVTGVVQRSIGSVIMQLQHRDANYDVKFEVIDGPVPNILSGAESARMKLVRRINHVSYSPDEMHVAINS